MIVADTNLIAYLIVPGEHTSSVEEVFARDSEWHAPVLWRSEFRNVLVLYVRRNLLPTEKALEYMQRAEKLMQGREYQIASDKVLDVALKSNCAAYDCEFVALAQELGVPLVTSDAHILKSFPSIALLPQSFTTT